MLEIGLNLSLHIREERLSTQQDACRLVYISDIHLRCGRSERICQQVMAAVQVCQPDAVLLGGDLLDAASELSCLSNLVGQLGTVAPLLAMGGNHDRAVGMEKVREAVLRGSGQWIHGQVAHLRHGNRTIAISGPEAVSQCDGDVRILCAHNPRIWKTSRQQGYDLVLAGHLHGCQVVAFEYQDRLFPGAFFYPYCYLSHQSGSTRLVVSRGVSDLVPIRWRCPREVVLCYV
jgi:predicted MPP superfamily phosphohydrolase